MTKHIHAELMLQYAKDAMETDKPWELWEYSSHNEIEWKKVESHPIWNDKLKYRRKPQTININGHEVPEPMRAKPKMSETFYTVSLNSSELVDYDRWDESVWDIMMLERGLCHSTKDNAIKHAIALMSFTEEC